MYGFSDIIGQAQTGTGKTAAFALPILDLLDKPAENYRGSLQGKSGHKEKKKVKALVLVPTRELAIQVTDEFRSLKGERKTAVETVYGGQSIVLQLRALSAGVDIVVGTPGRIIDHMTRGSLDLSEISFLVLMRRMKCWTGGFRRYRNNN